MAKSFRELLVWQKSIELAGSVYTLTETFPKSEIYGLTSQMRRAAVSIASNIAEGAGRSTRKDFRLFVVTARGSNFELQTQLEIAKTVGLVNATKTEPVEALSHDIGKMLHG